MHYRFISINAWILIITMFESEINKNKIALYCQAYVGPFFVNVSQFCYIVNICKYQPKVLNFDFFLKIKNLNKSVICIHGMMCKIIKCNKWNMK